MTDLAIRMDLRLRATDQAIFHAISSPEGLCTWWARSASACENEPMSLQLGFGPEYQWKVKFVEYLPHARLVLEFLEASEAWKGSTLVFEIKPIEGERILRVTHSGWKHDSHEMRRTAYCWPHVLGGLKKVLEQEVAVPFEERNYW